ncbi:hypothetical protein [Deinococcus altitudinis]|uniref:hypothetical protein n=1 Tax=Deinococcus altitudinis TaxID=468914 RepID=UPI00389137AA
MGGGGGMGGMDELLTHERQRVQRAWLAYHRPEQADPLASAHDPPVAAELLASWRRSSQSVPQGRSGAPVENFADVQHAWEQSPLEFASRPLVAELRALADEGEMVVAIADASGRIAWTQGSRQMQTLAQRLNFVPGGHWDEASVGTNALALALRHHRPVRVFAAEHYVQAVHDWVCYSSPIRHPQSGELLGVLDFSTTWEHSSPLGLAGARYYAQQIEQGLLPDAAAPTLETLRLNLCGSPEVHLGRRALHLTRRQHELLAVLALNPAGLTLDALHAHVYGDQQVTLSTLKSEISTLRGLLGGAVASRPYRLLLGVTFDAQSVEGALLGGQVKRALDSYGGPLLPYSRSPLLGYWREYLEVALREASLNSGDPEVLWRAASHFDDPELLQALDACLPGRDPRRPVVHARLAALVNR